MPDTRDPRNFEDEGIMSAIAEQMTPENVEKSMSDVPEAVRREAMKLFMEGDERWGDVIENYRLHGTIPGQQSPVDQLISQAGQLPQESLDFLPGGGQGAPAGAGGIPGAPGGGFGGGLGALPAPGIPGATGPGGFPPAGPAQPGKVQPTNDEFKDRILKWILKMGDSLFKPKESSKPQVNPENPSFLEKLIDPSKTHPSGRSIGERL